MIFLDPDATSDRKTSTRDIVNRTYQPHEFAKRAGVTIRALHHYDRLGLLKPSGRTAAGYRLYSDRDLVRLEQIVALKFIGFPLSQIRELLNRKDLDVLAALRQQRQIIGEKREHLDRAIRAIERAEQAVSSGEQADWEPFRKIIEVIQMQTRKDWMKKYYTEEQLTDLRQRWSPEVQAESERAWNELARDVEAAIARGEAPESQAGRELAERRQKLLNLFTGGDAGIAENLQKLYADKANWPATFKKPYSDEVGNFLCEAAKGLVKA
ncbi:MAG TPA: MerR family transcriptional regulator [Candidatus Dormibacteraeota bacterium]|nr:MerR family transcriptional regulator [Candidatus Dormibacteraeota bacterium]